MLARGKGLCVWLVAIGCSHSGSRGQPAQDAQFPLDRASDLVDSAKPHCIDPFDGGLADGAVVEEPNGFQTEGRLPLVAMDEQGNGIVVWSVGAGMTWRAYARRYMAGVGWSKVELVLENGYATSVALRDGTALVALAAPTDSSLEAGIYAATFSTSGWSVLPVGATSVGSLLEPSILSPVAVLGRSKALITWIDANSNQIAARVFDVAWQPAQLFGSPIGAPSALVLSSGGFVVAWTELSQANSPSWIAVSRSWDPSAGWLPALTVSQDARYIQLAACIDGSPHALLSASGGWAHAELLSSGEWSAGEIVVAFDQVTYIDSQHLVTDLASDALVAWTTHPGAACNSTVAARYYVGGAGWQSITLLNPSQNETHYELADLAMAASGNAWALGRSGPCDDTDQKIWARHFDPANGWANPVELDSTSACTVNDGSVATGGNRTLAAWSRTGTGGIVVRWLE